MDQDSNEGVDLDIVLDADNVETPAPTNCTTCKMCEDPCGGWMCRRLCTWYKIGRQCRSWDMPRDVAEANMIASLADPETASVDCPSWAAR